MVPTSRLIGILTGPTASGKTAIALELARRARAQGRSPIEIINADSLNVYRGFDIGTAKPTREERAEIPHHLVDICEPDVRYDVGDFVRDARAAIDDIHARGARALLVGGTGFYLKALLFGLWESPPSDPALRAQLEAQPNAELYQELFSRDEQAALRIGGNDRYRLIRAVEILRLSGRTPSELQSSMPRMPDPNFRLWTVDRDSEELEARITARTREMLKAGFIEETQSLRERHPHAPGLTSVGYAQIIDHLDGRVPEGRKIRAGLAGLQDEIELATRQLVKKQRTWCRSIVAQTSGARFVLERDREALLRAAESVYS